ncbi:MAG: hypothetical protein K9M55_03650 [Candidatus Marinimicrobia bacterium]|nr:hypothetical protein [Candidatus Neomarinimicrobiota bacterium]MCF7921774.1 hypothetical protein [Candidatus Neomarinimicrobiota bacterium]
MWIKTILLLVLTVIVFLSGYWLHRAGSPYGTFVLAIHKLVALVAIVIIGSLLVAAQRRIGLSGGDAYVVAAAVVLLIAAMASGGFISAMETAPKWVLVFHRIIPYFSAIAAGACVYISWVKA